MRIRLTLTVLIVTCGLIGCESDSGGGGIRLFKRTPASQPVERSLYDRLGGEPAIRAIVEDFVNRVQRDPRLNFARAGTDREWHATPEAIALLQQHMVSFIGEATGGPLRYRGQDMRTAHRGMRITEAEFGAALEDFELTLEQLRVGEREREELLALIRSSRSDIVQPVAP